MSLSNLLTTSQKKSSVLGARFRKCSWENCPCCVSLTTTLTPRCLIGSFVVQIGARAMTAILQLPGMKTVPVNEEHTPSLTLLT